MLPRFQCADGGTDLRLRTIENEGPSWHKWFMARRALFPTSSCTGDDDHFVPIASPAPLATKLLKV
jgi:hypothetical protein